MYQNTTVVGHVGRDAEMRYTPGGKPVTSFSVATSRKWTGADGEQHEKTTWFRATCWAKTAEIAAQYVKKGMLILVEGEIDASAFTGRDGEARASLELTVQKMKFLGKRGENNGGGEESTGYEPGGALEDDEIPF